MRIEFSPESRSDIDAIGDYIAVNNPLYALNFTNQLFDRCEEILNAPEGYVPRPDMGRNFRSVAFKGYVIFYATHSDFIRIERVFHGSRDYGPSDFG